MQDLVPARDRQAVEEDLLCDGRPVRLKRPGKHGFAELFTLGEINQNIFVYAARQAGLPLLTWDDVRRGQALTSSLTHELEGRFNFDAWGQLALPPRSPRQAAEILVALAERHDFTFYKYQMADLVSHTGQVELARAVFEIIEAFIEAVLEGIDPSETVVIVTSDHGHLEQVGFTRGHPKSKVPSWYFGPDAEAHASRLRRPEGIFHVIAEHGRQLWPASAGALRRDFGLQGRRKSAQGGRAAGALGTINRVRNFVACKATGNGWAHINRVARPQE